MTQDKPLLIRRTSDFEITGIGTAPQWEHTSWEEIPRRTGQGKAYETRAKVLYSEKGLYCLMICEDEQLTVTLEEDFTDLYDEDVVEIFFWTDEAYPFYFEYELSPLNYELPLMVPNREGNFLGWLPWHYEGERKTRHQTSVKGGKKVPMAKVKSWTAEFFIPFALLNPLGHVPPQKGTKWRANIYRIDYDQGSPSYYQWKPTRGNFHQYKEFGTFLFE